MDKPDIELIIDRNENGEIIKVTYKNHVNSKDAGIECISIIHDLFGEVNYDYDTLEVNNN